MGHHWGKQNPEEPLGDEGEHLRDERDQQRTSKGEKSCRRKKRHRDGRRGYRAAQYVTAGLVDGLSVHLIALLFGSGTQMFAHLGEAHIQLEPAQTIMTPKAIHLRLRIVK